MTIKEAFEMEKAVCIALGRLKNTIVSDIRAAGALDGVEVLPGPIPTVIASRDAIIQSKSLSPEEYIPDMQADMVSQALMPCRGVGEVFQKIQGMVSSGCVVLPRRGTAMRVRLNPKTLEVLKAVSDFETEVV